MDNHMVQLSHTIDVIASQKVAFAFTCAYQVPVSTAGTGWVKKPTHSPSYIYKYIYIYMKVKATGTGKRDFLTFNDFDCVT